MNSQKLDIDPQTYMKLIFNLTEDWSRRDGGGNNEYKVTSKQDQGYLTSEQVLTELGICYTTNNYLLSKLSTR